MGKVFQKLKLQKLEKQVLRKIKNRQVKNIERVIRIGGMAATDPRSAKPLTASYVNLSNTEASKFRVLERKGLISAFGQTEYFTNFRLTEKGKAQFRRR